MNTYFTPYPIPKKLLKNERDRTAKAIKAVRDCLRQSDLIKKTAFSCHFTLLILILIIILTISLFSCQLAHAEASSGLIEGYTLKQWVESIHKAEGNDNYGILSISCQSKEECRKICSNTVRNNYKRWKKSGKVITFMQFLGKRYCPVGASNDPAGLNGNWIANVRHFLIKGGV